MKWGQDFFVHLSLLISCNLKTDNQSGVLFSSSLLQINRWCPGKHRGGDVFTDFVHTEEGRFSNSTNKPENGDNMLRRT